MIIKSIMTDEDRKALEYMLSLEYIIVSIVPCMQLIISAHRQLGWRFLI